MKYKLYTGVLISSLLLVILSFIILFGGSNIRHGIALLFSPAVQAIGMIMLYGVAAALTLRDTVGQPTGQRVKTMARNPALLTVGFFIIWWT